MTFAEAVLALLQPTPVLLNDLIRDLRDGVLPDLRRWRNVRPQDVERILRDAGAHFASREHGAGLAVYVSSVPFTTVVDGRGKVRPVFAY